MKVLQINCVFRSGSTGKIVNDIHEQLCELNHNSYVCYGRGANTKQCSIYKVTTEFEAKFHALMNKIGFILPFSGMFLATNRLNKYIRKVNPDIVHVHCINGHSFNIYMLLSFLAKNNYRTLITHHAEFFYTGSCAYSYECNQYLSKISPCQYCPQKSIQTTSGIFKISAIAWRRMYYTIQKFKRDKLLFAAVSPWVKERSSNSRIVAGYNCLVVENGIDTKVFNYSTDLFKEIESKLPSNFSNRVLHVTASFNPNEDGIKGSKHIVYMAKMMPQTLFIVAASYISETKDLPANVFLWGRTKSQKELAGLYSLSDVCILTSKRETFSMICAEALSCGTPVVGFKAGGPETIAIPEYSTFVNYGDYIGLENAISFFIDNKPDKTLVAKISQQRYSKERMTADYLTLYKKLLLNEIS